MVAQLLYVSSAWLGFFKADEKSRLPFVVKKAQWYVYLRMIFKILDVLRKELNDNLFYSFRYNSYHFFTGSYCNPMT